MIRSKILKWSSHTYLLQSWKFSALTKQAIKANNEHKASMYAQIAFHCASRSIHIERRMLRSIRPIIRTVDINGSFEYYRLVRGEAKPLEKTK